MRCGLMCGRLAQMVERPLRMREVGGSIDTPSVHSLQRETIGFRACRIACPRFIMYVVGRSVSCSIVFDCAVTELCSTVLCSTVPRMR